MKKSIQVSKGSAFKMCFYAVLFIFVFMAGIALTLIYTKKVDPALAVGWIPVTPCLTVLCSLTAGFIGFSIANNGVKGKFWNTEMFEHENRE